MRIAWGRQLKDPRCLRPNACDAGPLQDAQTNVTTTDRMRDINSMVRSRLFKANNQTSRSYVDKWRSGERRRSIFRVR